MGTDGREAWFPVRDNDAPEQIATLINQLLDRDVLPALESKQHESDLITVWKTGRGPLLVEAQRLQFLAVLLHRAGRHEELAEVRRALEQIANNPFAMRALQIVRALGG